VRLDYPVFKPIAHGCVGLFIGRRTRPTFIVRHIDGRAVAHRADASADARLARRRVAA
jgi:hypothetical protein